MKLFLVALLYLAVTGNNEWVALADEAPGLQGKVPAPQHTTTLTVPPHATETSRSFVSPTASPAPTDITKTVGPGEGYGCFYHQGPGEQAQKGLTKGAEGQGQPQKAAATGKGTSPSSRDGHDAQEGSHQGADEGSH